MVNVEYVEKKLRTMLEIREDWSGNEITTLQIRLLMKVKIDGYEATLDRIAHIGSTRLNELNDVVERMENDIKENVKKFVEAIEKLNEKYDVVFEGFTY